KLCRVERHRRDVAGQCLHVQGDQGYVTQQRARVELNEGEALVLSPNPHQALWREAHEVGWAVPGDGGLARHGCNMQDPSVDGDRLRHWSRPGEQALAT